MKIAVIGVGGVGGYFGGRLAQHFDTAFISRGSTYEAIKANGLKVASINGDFHINPVNVSDNYSTVGPVSLVLVCVKSQQVEQIIDEMAPLVGEDTIILPLLNGVDAIDQLQNKYGNHVIGGFCRIISFKVAPGVINHRASTPIVDIGEVSGPVTQRIRNVEQLFKTANIVINTHDNFLPAQWFKMVFICVTSGIGAVTRSTFGEYREIHEVRDMVTQACQEGMAIAASCGAKLSDEFPSQILGAIDSLAYDGTTSMQRDIQDGNPSEIDYLLGSLVRVAKQNNINAPLTSFLYYSLLPQEFKAREISKKT